MKQLNFLILNQLIQQSYIYAMSNNLDLIRLDSICHECTYSIDFNAKSKAETFLFNFTKKISLNDINQILMFSSQNTLFTICHYLKSNLIYNQEIKSLYLLLVQKLISWQTQNGQIVRNNEYLSYHVFNTYTSLLGQTMKNIYRNYENRAWLNEEMNCHPKRFLLLQWTYLIETISTIDTQMGFSNYRNLVYVFQADAILKSLNVMVFYFKKLSEIIKINDLVEMQSKLNINNDFIKEEGKNILTFSQSESYQLSSVLKLLDCILNFPFNITFNQYDMIDSDYESNRTYFPPSLAFKFLEQQFYQSLFFLTERLIIQGNKNSQILLFCLSSLEKIVSCRIPTEIKKENIHRFLEISLRNIIRLMKHNRNEIKIMDRLIDFNIKMVKNHNLADIDNMRLIEEWFSLMFQFTQFIIQYIPLTVTNKTLNSTLMLVCQIVQSCVKPKLYPYRQFIKIKVKSIVFGILKYILIQNNDIIDVEAIDKIEEIKIKQLKSEFRDFFQNILMLIKLNFQETMDILTNIQQKLFSVAKTSFATEINFYFLITQFMSQKFYSWNTFLEHPSKFSLLQMGKLIKCALKCMNQYFTVKISDVFILEIAFLTFNEKFLIQSLNNLKFITSNNQKVSNRYGQSQLLFHEILGISAEQVLSELNLLFIPIINQFQTGDIRRISFAQEILNSCICKLKQSVHNQIFKNIKVFEDILINCLNIVKHKYLCKPELAKSRIGLFKIITVLGFNTLNDYKSQMDSVFSLLSINSDSCNLLTLVYDLRGVGQQIDSSEVFFYFLYNIYPIINKIQKEYYYSKDYKLISQTIKLDKIIVSNKFKRLNSLSAADLVKKFIDNSMPHWNYILVELSKINLSQKSLSLFIHMYSILLQILDGNYLNLFMLDQNYLEVFLFNLLTKITITIPQAFTHPKLLKVIFRCIFMIVSNISKLLFSYEHFNFAKLYSDLFIALKVPLFIFTEEVSFGNKKNQEFLKEIFEIYKEMISFITVQIKRRHLIIPCQNAILFKNTDYDKKLELIIELFKICSNVLRNKEIFLKITNLIRRIANFYVEAYQIVNAKFEEMFQVKNSQLVSQIFQKQQYTEEDEMYSHSLSQFLKTQQFQNYIIEQY